MKKCFVSVFSFLVAITFIISSNGTVKGAASLPPGGFLAQQGPPPPGANDPTCRPDAAHPEPIILVPGTFETMERNWANLSPLLAAKGYCVYSLNYGLSNAGPASGPIEDSAAELAAFIDNVLKHTGAKKVSIVGHSQGGMMPRYYIKYLGGSKKVDDLIGLVPSNHGTIGVAGLSGLTSLGSGLGSCAACDQQRTGSDFLRKLNEGDETPGKVSYTVVATSNDEVVVPYTSSFLGGPSQQVKNITLQDYYPLDQIEHQGISYDPNAFTFVYDALAHEGPAEPDRAVTQ
ncbi:esterase/lipase family protein [Bacillus sp. V33-4]|uniref:esterase/lipase family protein n=1 Tax=Bacillus sp. V33-4 TaxID=2054169 RepID=UPI000C760EB1|nr:alpha/beta fold hydrolase [Bacillus sp. V33-4]PLR81153.1 lipase [Bacillus sp. V33-4]